MLQANWVEVSLPAVASLLVQAWRTQHDAGQLAVMFVCLE